MEHALERAHGKELAAVFRKYGDLYVQKHNPSKRKLCVMRAIRDCRTKAMGGHKEKCSHCGDERFSYNSCRNRHCPKCQFLTKEKWIEKESQSLLPIQYYHVVFTIPAELNTLFLQNQKQAYGMLFAAVKSTLLQLSKDKKYLGAEIGCLSILHTWGQNLAYHPHIHCIVTGGGLDASRTWLHTRDNFFLPVRVMSRLFRGKLLSYLKKADRKKSLRSSNDINAAISPLYKKEWIVYCKPPFKNAKNVIQYLGRYTHRIAISNQRIIGIENGKVSFHWRDYKDHNRKKLMTLDAVEFIRRFSQHILPPRFVKIRRYGILSNKKKTAALKICRSVFKTQAPTVENKETWREALFRIKGFDVTLCTECAKGHYHRLEILQPIHDLGRSP